MPGYMGSGITVGASWRLSLALQPCGFVIQLVGECEELAIGLMAAREPFVPTDDNLVLESGLPTADPRVRQMRELAQALRAHPDDLSAAMRLASRQLAMGVAEADPRFIGYARGTLAPWWRDDHAAPALRVLRARILQAQHDFAPATVDLRAVLRDAPDAAQALLVLASIDEVTGDLAEAKEACTRFAALRPGLTAIACAAGIGSLTGEAVTNEAALANALARYPTAEPGQRLWALTILGEIAMRRDDSAAEQYFKEALALDPRDVYVLTVYADYLLDRSRAAEVLRLLRGFERVDALYLRLALAAQATGDAGFDGYREDVAARFAAARRQGDVLHLRDASRFALEIEHDSARALDFAKQNWEVHKTPYDAHALLAAAAASKDRAAAQPVTDWVSATRLEDKAIERLIQSVTGSG
jgi:predicted Zn-dependent protease